MGRGPDRGPCHSEEGGRGNQQQQEPADSRRPTANRENVSRQLQLEPVIGYGIMVWGVCSSDVLGAAVGESRQSSVVNATDASFGERQVRSL